MKSMNSKIENYQIDAKGKALGRIATKVSIILTGKNKPNYTPNIITNVMITIENIDKVSVSQKKLENTKYYKHSGYPGGLKTYKWIDLYKKSPKDLFMKVLKNMLPENRHRAELLKRVKFN